MAQRLNRRWIGCDQSRVAVAVTAERLKQSAVTRELETAPYPDFTIEQWGIYEAERLSALPPSDFRKFVLSAYGATRTSTDSADEDALIHGWQNRLPIWVGAPELASQATAADVRDFANAVRRTAEYQQANLRFGVMLAWGFRQDAVEAAEHLRGLQDVDVNFIELEQVSIGESGFRERVMGQRMADKDDYGEFLTFVQPPQVNVGFRARKGKTVTFDAGDTAVVNSDAHIINVQWDFNYDGARFTATQGYSFQKGRGKNKMPQLRVTHKFARAGKFRVACKVQDSRGGEGMWTGEVEVRV